MKEFFHKENLSGFPYEQLLPLVNKTKEEKQFLLSVLDSLKHIIIVTDLDGRVIHYNKMTSVCFCGLSLQSYIWDLFENNILAKDVKEAILEGKDFQNRSYLLSHFCDQGCIINDALSDTFRIRVSVFPLVQKGISNNITKIEGTVFIAEDESGETETQQKNNRDRLFMSMKNIMVGIAHELKNPLGSISIHLQLLQRRIKKIFNMVQEDKKNIIDSINVIGEEIENMEKVMNMFLRDFRLDSMNFESENLNKVIKTLLAFVQPDASNKRIEFVVNLSQKVPNAKISKHALMHALLNIIKNSIDEMSETGGVISITTNYVNGKIQIGIADTGSGITEEICRNIFDPYFTTKDSGSGVGLTIANKIIQMHGGTLSYNSSYKKGARFTVTLPPHATEQQLLSYRSRAK